LQRAASDLENLQHTTAAGRSSIYISAPVGPADQADYLNAVIALDSGLEPLTLLDQLQALEKAAGRQRGLRWGPRTLDLDLLLYDALEIRSERLTVPHPHMFERNFVLEPLAEILGRNWTHSDGLTLAQHLANCPHNPLSKTALSWRTDAAKAVNA
jgi:2-amino-4-hydroxy-6-hydroxymethyldihydropteridine diphosphokinase